MRIIAVPLLVTLAGMAVGLTSPPPVAQSSISISDCQWISSVGDKESLNPANTTALDSVVSRGVVEVELEVPTGVDFKIAYGVEIDTGAWMRSGAAKFVELDATSVRILRTNGVTDTVLARLPMQGGVTFVPAITNPQSLWVYVGDGQSMVVGEEAVTGFAVEAEYSIASSMPLLGIIPPPTNLHGGIRSGGPKSFFLVRADSTQAEVITLDCSGPRSLMPSLAYPETVLMMPGEHQVEVVVDYSPYANPVWANVDKELEINALSSSGVPARGTLLFSGRLTIAEDDGTAHSPDLPSAAFERGDCDPAVIKPGVPAVVFYSSECGTGSLFNPGPDYPADADPDWKTGGHFVEMDRYSCPGIWDPCNVISNTGSYTGFEVTNNVILCWTFEPALGVPPWKRVPGTQNIVSLKPATVAKIFSWTDCTP